MNRAKIPAQPSVATPVLKPWRTSSETSGNSVARVAITPKIKIAWVSKKVRKIGISAVTDSFTPRRFIKVNRPMTMNSTGSLKGCQSGGKKLKQASAPLAIEVVTVRT